MEIGTQQLSIDNGQGTRQVGLGYECDGARIPAYPLCQGAQSVFVSKSVGTSILILSTSVDGVEHGYGEGSSKAAAKEIAAKAAYEALQRQRNNS
jgi:hypothetical protein